MDSRHNKEKVLGVLNGAIGAFIDTHLMQHATRGKQSRCHAFVRYGEVPAPHRAHLHGIHAEGRPNPRCELSPDKIGQLGTCPLVASVARDNHKALVMGVGPGIPCCVMRPMTSAFE